MLASGAEPWEALIACVSGDSGLPVSLTETQPSGLISGSLKAGAPPDPTVAG